MKLDSTIKRLEKRIDEIRQTRGGVKVFICEPGESPAACLARHGVTEDSPDLNVVIVKFVSGQDYKYPQPAAAPEPRSVQDIDIQIQALIEELRADGYTGKQIAELVAKGSDENV